MSNKTVLFWNPTAYSGRAAECIDYARELLRDFGIEHEAIATQPHRRTVELVRHSIDQGETRCAIAMGGDGTLSEVVSGILTSRHASTVTMGILPSGTANNQGKSFGMNAGVTALAENVRTIAEGRTLSVDVGRLQQLGERDEAIATEWFFDSMGVGWGAQIVALANLEKARVSTIPLLKDFYRDQWLYIGATIRQAIASLSEDTTFDLQVEIDGTSYFYPHVIDAIIKNTLIYAGDWIPAPDSLPDDGYFELIPIASPWEFICKAIATFRYSPFTEDHFRAVGIPLSRPRRGSSFIFSIARHGYQSAPVGQIDGEEYEIAPRFRIDVCKQVLRFIVPPSYRRT